MNFLAKVRRQQQLVGNHALQHADTFSLSRGEGRGEGERYHIEPFESVTHLIQWI